MKEPHPRNFWERLNNLALTRFLLWFAAGWALIQLLAYFETVILIFTFATILAFLLNYPTRWFQRFLPHGLAASVVFLLSLFIIFTLITTVGLAFLSQGQQLIDSVIEILNSLALLVEQAEESLQNRNIQVDLEVIEGQIRNWTLSGISFSLAFVQKFLTNLLTLVVIAVVAFFMLLDGERLWSLALKLLPRYLRHNFTATIQRNFLGFFRGQLILVLFLSFSTFVVFSILNVPFALILAVIIGAFDLIPGIGATLGIGIISLIVLSQSFWLALKVLLASIVLQQIQDNLIAPRVMQNSLNVNPVVIFFALLVGARVAGLLGIFLAVPIAGVLVSLFEIDEMKGET